MMRVNRFLAAAAALFVAALPVRADQILGPGRIQSGTNKLILPGGPTLGTYQNGQYTSQPYNIQIQGSGSTGDVSGMCVKAFGQTICRNLFALFTDVPYITLYGGAGDFNGTTGTDNLAAWNAAAATGKCVKFPAGRYYFSATPSTITNSNLCAYGDGVEATVLIFAASATDGLVANQANYSQTVTVVDMTLATLGNETGSAIKASWSDADATLNSNERRFTARNVLFRGEGNQSHGWKRGYDLNNAQHFNISNSAFVGRQTNNGATPADTLYADDAIYITSGAYGTVAGHISNFIAYSAKRCINLYNGTTSIEGLNVSQFDCVGVGTGIAFNPGLASPGFVASNGHINSYSGGITGKFATDATLTNMLIYKTPSSTSDWYCFNLANSSYSVIANNTCKNQAPNVSTSGNAYGIRLTDSTYDQINGNLFVLPTTGVTITGASGENFGRGNVTAGNVTNGTTSAVIDTSSGVNTIGTGNRIVSGANLSATTTATIGNPVSQSTQIGAHVGEKFRVTATLYVTNGATAGEVLNIVKVGTGSGAASGVFQASAGQLTDRRPIAASATQSSTVTGIFTVTTTGTLQFTQFGQTTGSTGSVAAGDAQISAEQL